jgi:hypothetical protein
MVAMILMSALFIPIPGLANEEKNYEELATE